MSHLVGRRHGSTRTKGRGKGFLYTRMHFSGFCLQRMNVTLPNCPLSLYKERLFFFKHSIKMPQRPLGRLLMTVPDRLPYGESDIPDASVYQVSRSIVTSPLGLEKQCCTGDAPRGLLSCLTSEPLKACSSPGAPVLCCQVKSLWLSLE